MKVEIVEGVVMSFEGAKGLQSVEHVGIDNLKQVAEFSIRFRNKLVKYQKDNHIDWFERFGLGIALMGAIKLIPIWKLIKAEILDLDKEEYYELLEIIAKGFGFDSELAKEYFGDFIHFIDGLVFFFTKSEAK